MHSFLSKVFGRKKEDKDTSPTTLRPGELLDGKFEAVSPNVSPGAANFLELDNQASPETSKDKDKEVVFSLFRAKSRPSPPEIRGKKPDTLPHLSLDFSAINGDTNVLTLDQTILSDAIIGRRRLNPMEAIVLIRACSQAIVSKGLETLGIMHPHWYSASPEVQRRLISQFIHSMEPQTPPTAFSPNSAIASPFESEIDLAHSPHDIAAVLRWGLRHLRLDGDSFGTDDGWYKAFLDAEAAAEYPPKAFSEKLAPLLPPAHLDLLTAALELFSYLAAHSEANGTSGSKLSKIFGLWLLTARQVEDKDDWQSFYARWERTGRMLEHLFLSRIRDESTDQRMPVRLLELVRRYPYTQGLSSPTTDLQLLPRPQFTTQYFDAFFVRIEVELPSDRRKPTLKVHPLNILADAFSTKVEEGEYAELWAKITAASKTGSNPSPLSNIFADETIRFLSIIPDKTPSKAMEPKSPTFSLLPVSASSPRGRSFSASDNDKPTPVQHPKSATEPPPASAVSALAIGSDWAQFSSSGFLDTSPAIAPLVSTLFDTDIEKTLPPATPLSRKASKRSKAASRKSVDFSPEPVKAITEAPAEEIKEDPKSIVKATNLQVIQIDEAFIDFWSDSLLDPITATWPTFIICKFKSTLVPKLQYAPAGEDGQQKTLKWLVLEQVITVKPAPAPPVLPASPTVSVSETARPVSPALSTSGKNRFSFWSMSRTSSSSSQSSQKGKKKEKQLNVNEMGELIEEESADQVKSSPITLKSFSKSRRSTSDRPKDSARKSADVAAKSVVPTSAVEAQDATAEKDKLAPAETSEGKEKSGVALVAGVAAAAGAVAATAAVANAVESQPPTSEVTNAEPAVETSDKDIPASEVEEAKPESDAVEPVEATAVETTPEPIAEATPVSEAKEDVVQVPQTSVEAVVEPVPEPVVEELVVDNEASPVEHVELPITETSAEQVEEVVPVAEVKEEETDAPKVIEKAASEPVSQPVVEEAVVEAEVKPIPPVEAQVTERSVAESAEEAAPVTEAKQDEAEVPQVLEVAAESVVEPVAEPVVIEEPVQAPATESPSIETAVEEKVAEQTVDSSIQPIEGPSIDASLPEPIADKTTISDVKEEPEISQSPEVTDELPAEPISEPVVEEPVVNIHATSVQPNDVTSTTSSLAESADQVVPVAADEQEQLSQIPELTSEAVKEPVSESLVSEEHVDTEVSEAQPVETTAEPVQEIPPVAEVNEESETSQVPEVDVDAVAEPVVENDITETVVTPVQPADAPVSEAVEEVREEPEAAQAPEVTVDSVADPIAESVVDDTIVDAQPSESPAVDSSSADPVAEYVQEEPELSRVSEVTVDLVTEPLPKLAVEEPVLDVQDITAQSTAVPDAVAEAGTEQVVEESVVEAEPTVAQPEEVPPAETSIIAESVAEDKQEPEATADAVAEPVAGTMVEAEIVDTKTITTQSGETSANVLFSGEPVADVEPVEEVREEADPAQLPVEEVVQSSEPATEEIVVDTQGIPDQPVITESEALPTESLPELVAELIPVVEPKEEADVAHELEAPIVEENEQVIDPTTETAEIEASEPVKETATVVEAKEEDEPEAITPRVVEEAIEASSAPVEESTPVVEAKEEAEALAEVVNVSTPVAVEEAVENTPEPMQETVQVDEAKENEEAHEAEVVNVPIVPEEVLESSEPVQAPVREAREEEEAVEVTDNSIQQVAEEAAEPSGEPVEEAASVVEPKPDDDAQIIAAEATEAPIIEARDETEASQLPEVNVDEVSESVERELATGDVPIEVPVVEPSDEPEVTQSLEVETIADPNEAPVSESSVADALGNIPVSEAKEEVDAVQLLEESVAEPSGEKTVSLLEEVPIVIPVPANEAVTQEIPHAEPAILETAKDLLTESQVTAESVAEMAPVQALGVVAPVEVEEATLEEPTPVTREPVTEIEDQDKSESMQAADATDALAEPSVPSPESGAPSAVDENTTPLQELGEHTAVATALETPVEAQISSLEPVANVPVEIPEAVPQVDISQLTIAEDSIVVSEEHAKALDDREVVDLEAPVAVEDVIHEPETIEHPIEGPVPKTNETDVVVETDVSRPDVGAESIVVSEEAIIDSQDASVATEIPGVQPPAAEDVAPPVVADATPLFDLTPVDEPLAEESLEQEPQSDRSGEMSSLDEHVAAHTEVSENIVIMNETRAIDSPVPEAHPTVAVKEEDNATDIPLVKPAEVVEEVVEEVKDQQTTNPPPVIEQSNLDVEEPPVDEEQSLSNSPSGPINIASSIPTEIPIAGPEETPAEASIDITPVPLVEAPSGPLDDSHVTVLVQDQGQDEVPKEINALERTSGADVSHGHIMSSSVISAGSIPGPQVLLNPIVVDELEEEKSSRSLDSSELPEDNIISPDHAEEGLANGVAVEEANITNEVSENSSSDSVEPVPSEVNLQEHFDNTTNPSVPEPRQDNEATNTSLVEGSADGAIPVAEDILEEDFAGSKPDVSEPSASDDALQGETFSTQSVPDDASHDVNTPITEQDSVGAIQEVETHGAQFDNLITAETCVEPAEDLASAEHPDLASLENSIAPDEAGADSTENPQGEVVLTEQHVSDNDEEESGVVREKNPISNVPSPAVLQGSEEATVEDPIPPDVELLSKSEEEQDPVAPTEAMLLEKVISEDSQLESSVPPVEPALEALNTPKLEEKTLEEPLASAEQDNLQEERTTIPVEDQTATATAFKIVTQSSEAAFYAVSSAEDLHSEEVDSTHPVGFDESTTNLAQEDLVSNRNRPENEPSVFTEDPEPTRVEKEEETLDEPAPLSVESIVENVQEDLTVSHQPSDESATDEIAENVANISPIQADPVTDVPENRPVTTADSVDDAEPSSQVVVENIETEVLRAEKSDTLEQGISPGADNNDVSVQELPNETEETSSVAVEVNDFAAVEKEETNVIEESEKFLQEAIPPETESDPVPESVAVDKEPVTELPDGDAIEVEPPASVIDDDPFEQTPTSEQIDSSVVPHVSEDSASTAIEELPHSERVTAESDVSLGQSAIPVDIPGTVQSEDSEQDKEVSDGQPINHDIEETDAPLLHNDVQTDEAEQPTTEAPTEQESLKEHSTPAPEQVVDESHVAEIENEAVTIDELVASSELTVAPQAVEEPVSSLIEQSIVADASETTVVDHEPIEVDSSQETVTTPGGQDIAELSTTGSHVIDQYEQRPHDDVSPVESDGGQENLSVASLPAKNESVGTEPEISIAEGPSNETLEAADVEEQRVVEEPTSLLGDTRAVDLPIQEETEMLEENNSAAAPADEPLATPAVQSERVISEDVRPELTEESTLVPPESTPQESINSPEEVKVVNEDKVLDEVAVDDSTLLEETPAAEPEQTVQEVTPTDDAVILEEPTPSDVKVEAPVEDQAKETVEEFESPQQEILVEAVPKDIDTVDAVIVDPQTQNTIPVEDSVDHKEPAATNETSAVEELESAKEPLEVVANGIDVASDEQVAPVDATAIQEPTQDLIQVDEVVVDVEESNVPIEPTTTEQPQAPPEPVMVEALPEETPALDETSPETHDVPVEEVSTIGEVPAADEPELHPTDSEPPNDTVNLAEEDIVHPPVSTDDHVTEETTNEEPALAPEEQVYVTSEDPNTVDEAVPTVEDQDLPVEPAPVEEHHVPTPESLQVSDEAAKQETATVESKDEPVPSNPIVEPPSASEELSPAEDVSEELVAADVPAENANEHTVIEERVTVDDESQPLEGTIVEDVAEESVSADVTFEEAHADPMPIEETVDDAIAVEAKDEPVEENKEETTTEEADLTPPDPAHAEVASEEVKAAPTSMEDAGVSAHAEATATEESIDDAVEETTLEVPETSVGPEPDALHVPSEEVKSSMEDGDVHVETTNVEEVAEETLPLEAKDELVEETTIEQPDATPQESAPAEIISEDKASEASAEVIDGPVDNAIVESTSEQPKLVEAEVEEAGTVEEATDVEEQTLEGETVEESTIEQPDVTPQESTPAEITSEDKADEASAKEIEASIENAIVEPTSEEPNPVEAEAVSKEADPVDEVIAVEEGTLEGQTGEEPTLPQESAPVEISSENKENETAAEEIDSPIENAIVEEIERTTEEIKSAEADIISKEAETVEEASAVEERTLGGETVEESTIEQPDVTPQESAPAEITSEDKANEASAEEIEAPTENVIVEEVKPTLEEPNPVEAEAASEEAETAEEAIIVEGAPEGETVGEPELTPQEPSVEVIADEPKAVDSVVVDEVQDAPIEEPQPVEEVNAVEDLVTPEEHSAVVDEAVAVGEPKAPVEETVVEVPETISDDPIPVETDSEEVTQEETPALNATEAVDEHDVSVEEATVEQPELIHETPIPAEAAPAETSAKENDVLAEQTTLEKDELTQDQLTPVNDEVALEDSNESTDIAQEPDTTAEEITIQSEPEQEVVNAEDEVIHEEVEPVDTTLSISELDDMLPSPSTDLSTVDPDASFATSGPFALESVMSSIGEETGDELEDNDPVLDVDSKVSEAEDDVLNGTAERNGHLDESEVVLSEHVTEPSDIDSSLVEKVAENSGVEEVTNGDIVGGPSASEVSEPIIPLDKHNGEHTEKSVLSILPSLEENGNSVVEVAETQAAVVALNEA